MIARKSAICVSTIPVPILASIQAPSPR